MGLGEERRGGRSGSYIYMDIIILIYDIFVYADDIFVYAGKNSCTHKILLRSGQIFELKEEKQYNNIVLSPLE